MRELSLIQALLETIHEVTSHNRGHFKEHGVYVVNLMSTPGAGKTLDELRHNVLEVSPETTIFPVSCGAGEGVDEWIAWLKQKIEFGNGARICDRLNS